MFLNIEGTLNTELKQQMHEYMGTELALTQQFMQHLYNPRLYPLEVGRIVTDKYKKKELATARRNRKKLVMHSRKLP